MSSTAYASDGGSSTESEDDSAYLQVKSDPNIQPIKTEVEFSVVVKSEGVESHVPKQEVKQEMVKQEEPKQEAPKQELTSFDTPKQEPVQREQVQQEQVQQEAPKQELTSFDTPKEEPVQQEQVQQEALTSFDTSKEEQVQQEQVQQDQNATIPPCCTACGFPVLVVSQDEIDKAKEMLDCKCCNLVLPDSSYSNTQRSESRKEFRKCKACTGNVNRGAKPVVQPTREKPKKPSNKQNKKSEKQKGVSAVFTNQVGRLKMAQRALQRKRDEASKLKMTKRREEYEQQLDKEEKELQRQSALLRRQNAKAFQSLMEGIKIKKPPTHEKEKKSKKKKAQSFEKKRASKRKTDESSEQASKKRKGPVVDSSVFVPPTSASDEVPARVIPTRSRARAHVQPQAIEVKSEVKTELVKVEVKAE